MHTEIRLTGEWAWYLAVFGIAYAIFFMSGWLVDRMPVAKRLKDRLQIFFKHELSVLDSPLAFCHDWLSLATCSLHQSYCHFAPFMILFDLYTVYFFVLLCLAKVYCGFW